MKFKIFVQYIPLILLALVFYGAYILFRDGDIPELDENPYWGKGQPPKNPDEAIRKFKIHIDEKVLQDLNHRLKLELEGNRFTEPLEGIGFQYGINTNFLRNVTTHWLHNYNWREREAILNKFPHFITNVAGIDIHFQHIKLVNNTSGKTVPLLMLHGWPASFVEFQKAVPLLLKSDINFELVIPSLPGYGFSEGSHKIGFSAVEMGQIFLKLMKRLGHEKFYVQGGDWGAVVATNMGAMYPKNVKGLHLNMCFTLHFRTLGRILLAFMFPSYLMTEGERARLLPFTNIIGKLLRETGYFHLHATKPDTIGAALGHTPTGLAGYILEKIPIATNEEWMSLENGGVVPYYDLDNLLDNIMIYWVTNSITTSTRLYAESFNPWSTQAAVDLRVPVKVPTVYFHTPHEPLHLPLFAIKEKYPNIVRYTKATKGGHYPAFEIPHIFAEDVINSINFMENLHPSAKQELGICEQKFQDTLTRSHICDVYTKL